MKDNSLAFDLAGESPTERQLVWLHNKLYRPFTYAEAQVIPVTRDEYYQEVAQLISRRYFTDIQERQKYLRELTEQCSSALLPENHFRWIDPKDSRLCTWAWLYTAIQKSAPITINPENNGARRKDIIKYFDLLEASTHEKLLLLIQLRELWVFLSDRKAFDFDWIDEDNKEQCRWVLKYLENTRGMTLSTIPVDQRAIAFLTPFNAAMATIDLGQLTPQARHDLAQKMKAAWKQKNTRARDKNRTNDVSAQLTDKHLLMLQAISEMYEHKSSKETLRALIEAEYQKLKTSWLKKSL